MATRLLTLKVDHIAGVSSPANKRKFLIVKSEAQKETVPLSTDAEIRAYIEKHEPKETQSAINKRVSDEYAETITKAAELSGKSLAEYLSEHPSAYREYRKLAKVSAGAAVLREE